MSADLAFWFTQFLNGLQYSMQLFLLSIGLSVVFGLMHFVNLAHGSLYMIGAYIGLSIALVSGSFVLAVLIAPIVVAAIGAFLYWLLIKRLRQAGPINQVLVTFGLIFIFMDLVRIFWGDIHLGMDTPAYLSDRVDIFGVEYPSYRLFIISVGLIVMGVLSYVLAKTPIGSMIRAAVENDAMASALGIKVEKLFLAVFCVGCALAGLAGVLIVPLYSASASMGTEVLIPTLIVVVIGGLGSLRGAIAGSFIVGFMQTIGAVFLPSLAALLIYVLLAIILVVKPEGLLPARQ